MNSTQGLYKFLIFVVFTFTLLFAFLVFLPQRRFVLAGCRPTGHYCDNTWGYYCKKKSKCAAGADEFFCYVRFANCVDTYMCECGGPDCCGGGGCFVEGTEVATKELKNGETEKLKNIAELETGEIVSSFNPETGEISESQVAEVHKLTREGYYELETESGKKVKVTGEHPFLAVKKEENLISKLKNALSNTLTFRLITSLQTKLIEILD